MSAEGHQITVHVPGPKLIVQLVTAYMRAVERFRAAAVEVSSPRGQVSGEAFGWASMAEALNWADAIDENLRANDKPRPKSGDWTDDLPDASRPLWLAFQHARNIVHHRWWESQAIQIDFGPGDHVNTLVWAHLPSTGGRKPKDAEKAGAEAYVAHLQGRSILSTLDELAQVMWPYRVSAITEM